MGPLDLVLDVGKTRAKLLLLDAAGDVLHSADHACRSREQAGYLALDTADTEDWLCETLAGLGADRRRIGHAIATAHGAAFALVDDEALVLPVADYEFPGFDERPAGWAAQLDGFDETLSPDLPRGLNGATQLAWLERHHPASCVHGQWMPYAQYWAWWLSGRAASEVGSLGCHTQLWNPVQGRFTALAQRRGWAARFAPLRPAWETLGPLRARLAGRLGLRADLQVHVGAHDSNACLARHLREFRTMTLVSSGTWTVVMAPGAEARRLSPARDLLGNVSVTGGLVPTGRFMGGREVQQLCAGADPALANPTALDTLLARGVMALPAFEPQGGPFRERPGRVIGKRGAPVSLPWLPPAERATLAALYAAQVTAWIIEHLGAAGPVMLEGPLAHNAVYAAVLAALLPGRSVRASVDPLEGTARGAWQLIHWAHGAAALPPPRAIEPARCSSLAAYHARWLSALE